MSVACMLSFSPSCCPVMSTDVEGNVPLHAAAARGFLDIIIAIIRCNAYITLFFMEVRRVGRE